MKMNIFIIVACVGILAALLSLDPPAKPGMEKEVFYPSGLARLGYVEGNICSAVVVSDTYALTAHHCVEVCRQVHPFAPAVCKPNPPGMSLTIGDKNGIHIRPVTVHAMGLVDYAILKGDFKGIERAKMRVNYEYVLDEDTISCGYALPSAVPTCQSGTVTSFYFFSLKDDTTLLSRGMSGGPVYNKKGEVIAVNLAQAKKGAIYAPIRGVDGFL